MEAAAFSFRTYSFDKLLLDFENLGQEVELALSFIPSGIFNKKTKSYKLSFLFTALTKNDNKAVVSVLCNATFIFSNSIELNEIPQFFYPNSIAIVYPYIRAMVSTLTLQANVKPIILPTMNLSSLGDELRENTTLA